LIDAINPVAYGGIQQGLTAQQSNTLKPYVLGPLSILAAVVTPLLISFEVVIVESIAIETIQIAYVCDVKFNVVYKATRIAWILVIELYGHAAIYQLLRMIKFSVPRPLNGVSVVVKSL
jgi:hypothetical protein